MILHWWLGFWFVLSKLKHVLNEWHVKNNKKILTINRYHVSKATKIFIFCYNYFFFGGGGCKKPFANINHVLVTKTHSHEFHSESSLCFHHVIWHIFSKSYLLNPTLYWFNQYPLTVFFPFFFEDFFVKLKHKIICSLKCNCLSLVVLIGSLSTNLFILKTVIFII